MLNRNYTIIAAQYTVYSITNMNSRPTEIAVSGQRKENNNESGSRDFFECSRASVRTRQDTKDLYDTSTENRAIYIQGNDIQTGSNKRSFYKNAEV